MQANNDEGKLEEYDPTANPVGDLPLFDELEVNVESKKEIPTTADEKSDETKHVSASVSSSPIPYMKRPRKTLAQMAAEAQKESTGGKIVCPDCGCQDFRTTNTKVVEGFRKRLRICRHCGRPVDTIEFAIRE